VAGSDRPPEQVIRDWLEQHGTVSVRIAAIEETWQVERLSKRERRRVEKALEGVGVAVEPSLVGASRRDVIRLSLVESDEVSGVRGQDAEPRPVRLGLVVVAVGLMVVGSLGPWAKDIFVTDYGLDRDGALVIAAAGLAALILGVHARRGRPSRLPLLAAVLGAVAVGILASEFRDVLDDAFVEPAWGLYAAAAGSALLVALSMSLLVRRG
jgi:peptidoglycan/LPS O-acetylase OafA/YrhL